MAHEHLDNPELPPCRDKLAGKVAYRSYEIFRPEDPENPRVDKRVYDVPVFLGMNPEGNKLLYVAKHHEGDLDDPLSWLVCEVDPNSGECTDRQISKAEVDQRDRRKPEQGEWDVLRIQLFPWGIDSWPPDAKGALRNLDRSEQIAFSTRLDWNDYHSLDDGLTVHNGYRSQPTEYGFVNQPELALDKLRTGVARLQLARLALAA